MNPTINKYEYWFVMLIPVINIMVPFFIGDIEPRGIHLGTIRGGVLLVFCIYFIVKRFPLDEVNLYILFFLLYLLILIPFSDNPISSLYSYNRVVISTLMFSVGYYYIRTLDDLRNLNTIFVVTTAIICIYLVYTNLFNIGISSYLDGTFYTGVVNVNITKTLAAILITFPSIYLFKKTNDKLTIAIFVLSLIFILLGLKRAALLSVVSGTIIYVLLSYQKTRILKAATILASLLILLSPIYLDTLLDRYEKRERAVQATVNPKQSAEMRVDRIGEFIHIVDIMRSEDVYTKLFGKNLFNIVGVIEGFGGRGRPLHVDYSVYLYSSGMVGLFLFLSLYLVIHYEKQKYYKYIKMIPWTRELNAVFYAIIGLAMVMSIAGSWAAIELRTIILMYLGAITGVFYTEYEKQINKHE